jgi:hypothetical protein
MTHSVKTGAKGNSRTFGLDHQNGKGDKSRVSDPIAYKQNMSAIKFDGVQGMTRRRDGWLTKTYPRH